MSEEKCQHKNVIPSQWWEYDTILVSGNTVSHKQLVAVVCTECLEEIDLEQCRQNAYDDMD